MIVYCIGQNILIWHCTKESLSILSGWSSSELQITNQEGEFAFVRRSLREWLGLEVLALCSRDDRYVAAMICDSQAGMRGVYEGDAITQQDGRYKPLCSRFWSPLIPNCRECCSWFSGEERVSRCLPHLATAPCTERGVERGLEPGQSWLGGDWGSPMGVHNSTLSPRGSSIKRRWLRLGIDDQTARRYDSSLGGEGVTEMARLSQEVNASSINPSSPVQWREFSHS